jgi:tetratricopeptide (TPR) repeat protein
MFPRLGDWLIDRVVGPGGAFAAGLQNMRKAKFSTAIDAFKDAERLYAKRFGPHHPRVAEAIAYRAWCLAKWGRAAEAVPLYEAAIELERGRRNGERAKRLIEQLAWARERATQEQEESGS